MKNTKILLTDVDGTILDFASAFHTWMQRRGYEALEGKSLKNTFLISGVYDISAEEMKREVLDFSATDIFSTLHPLEGAVEAIEGLRSDDWQIVAITACHTFDSAREARIANLASCFGFKPEEILFSGLMGDKAELLKQFAPTFWVEDCLHHAKEGVRCGHHPILIDYPYNACDGIDSIEHLVFRTPNWLNLRNYIS